MVDKLILGKFSMLYRVVETLKRTCIIDVIASALTVHQHIAGCIDSVYAFRHSPAEIDSSHISMKF